MKKILMEVKHGDKTDLVFYCPGCRRYHWVQINPMSKPSWRFNNDFVKPTVSPSIIVKNEAEETVCHLFIKAGNLEYMDDCAHDFKALVVPMHSV